MVRLALLRMFESYFRHRWLYLLPIVLMAIIAGCAFVVAKPTYISSGVLYVQEESFLASLTSINTADYTWVTPSETTVSEIDELLQTDAFVRSVVLLTDKEAEMDQGAAQVAETLDWARKALWVQSLGDSLVMVAAADEQPELAQQLVGGTIETYTQWRIQSDQQASVVAESFFADLIQDYQASVDSAYQQVEQYLTDHPLPVRGDRPEEETLQIERLQAALDLASTRLANAMEKEEEARLALAQAESDVRQTYLLVDAPRLPTEPEISLKSVALNALVYIAIGVVLSGAGIIGGALFDHSLRFRLDVRHDLNLPVLAEVPTFSPTRRKRARRKKGQAADSQAGTA